MATVQELIAAARAQTPITGAVSPLENFLTVLNRSVSRNPLEGAVRLSQMRESQQRQEIQRNDQLRQQRAQRERQETLKRARKNKALIEEVEVSPSGVTTRFTKPKEPKGKDRLTQAQAAAFLQNDPQKLIQEFPNGIPGNIIKEFQQRIQKAEEQANNPELNLTTAQKEIDKQFAKDYVSFFLSGGFSDTQKSLEQLDNALDELGKTDTATGKMIGIIPKPLRDIVTPKGAAIQDQIEEVVQRNLRLVLGAQFTQEEGKRLIDRAFNPRQSEEENKKRVKRLLTQILLAAQAKQKAGEYFEEHGTLKGFKGTIITSIDELLPPEDVDIAQEGSAVRILNIRERK